MANLNSTSSAHHLILDRRVLNISKPSVLSKNANLKNKQAKIAETEDFDFWSMPNNETNKKKKEFVADSLLWANDKNIDQSVFMVNQRGNKGE
jgi:hypothetical protein